MSSQVTRYFARALFDGETLYNNVCLSVSDGRVVELTANASPENAQILDGLLTPGFIDVQVNGGGGVQFNLTPDIATLRQMALAHLRHGTTSMLPTVITDDFAAMQRAADAVASVLAQGQDQSVIGVHFEGPHISQAKKGMHSSQYIRPLSAQELALFTRQDLGKVIVTLAPEAVRTEDIRTLVNAGVKVCLGHSNADFDTAAMAINAGADGVTHLFNAMSALEGRAPGMVGAALWFDSVYCGLIVDHLHLHPKSAALAIKVKGAERIMLVTDAMAQAASDVTEFEYDGQTVTRVGDKLTLADGTLAGSALTMDKALINTCHDLGYELASCLRMASTTPAEYLGLAAEIGSLKQGSQANMLLLDQHSLAVKQVWLQGNLQE